MKAVVSRVHRAAVTVDGQVTGSVEQGLLVFVGVMQGDTEAQAQWMAQKLAALRIFSDEQGKMNRSVRDVGGGMLLISNFTLAGDARTGTRPSFSTAARPDEAIVLFEKVVELCGHYVPVGKGVFGAHMDIDASMNGPVTIILESPTG